MEESTKSYIVSGTVTVSFSYEVDAPSEEAAEEYVLNDVSFGDLLDGADCEDIEIHEVEEC